jgi:hypothetical protein
MIIISPRLRTDSVAPRWLPTGSKHAYLTTRSRPPTKPAIVSLNHHRNHQAEPPLPARHINNYLATLSAHMAASSASTKSP